MRVKDAVAKMGDWVFMSDVCKHCTNAGCLDACPTGALIRTEHQTVVLQPDVCNGCGYCVPACPFGVVDRDPEDGRDGYGRRPKARFSEPLCLIPIVRLATGWASDRWSAADASARRSVAGMCRGPPVV
jgi:Fe-S-cluster-containing dehydrogenase component